MLVVFAAGFVESFWCCNLHRVVQGWELLFAAARSSMAVLNVLVVFAAGFVESFWCCNLHRVGVAVCRGPELVVRGSSIASEGSWAAGACRAIARRSPRTFLASQALLKGGSLCPWPKRF